MNYDIALLLWTRPSPWYLDMCEYLNDVRRTITKTVESFPKKLSSPTSSHLTLNGLAFIPAARRFEEWLNS